jgi:hypothetical protein
MKGALTQSASGSSSRGRSARPRTPSDPEATETGCPHIARTTTTATTDVVIRTMIVIVDTKSALYAKHTASRTSLLSTRADSEACQSISLKLTKSNIVRCQSLELAGWYQTVPYLRLKPCEVTYSYEKLSVNRLKKHSGALKRETKHSRIDDVSMTRDRSLFKQRCSYIGS